MSELLLGCGHSRERRMWLPNEPKSHQWQDLVTLDNNLDCEPDLECDLNGAQWRIHKSKRKDAETIITYKVHFASNQTREENFMTRIELQKMHDPDKWSHDVPTDGKEFYFIPRIYIMREYEIVPGRLECVDIDMSLTPLYLTQGQEVIMRIIDGQF